MARLAAADGWHLGYHSDSHAAALRFHGGCDKAAESVIIRMQILQSSIRCLHSCRQINFECCGPAEALQVIVNTLLLTIAPMLQRVIAARTAHEPNQSTQCITANLCSRHDAAYGLPQRW
jgi:hypothetical protein